MWTRPAAEWGEQLPPEPVLRPLTRTLLLGRWARQGFLLLLLHLLPEPLLQLSLPELPLVRGIALCGSGGRASASGERQGGEFLS